MLVVGFCSGCMTVLQSGQRAAFVFVGFMGRPVAIKLRVCLIRMGSGIEYINDKLKSGGERDGERASKISREKFIFWFGCRL